MNNDILYWVWLSQKLGTSTGYIRALLERFGTVFDIYRAEDEELKNLGTRREDKLTQVLSDKNLNEANRILRRCEALGVDVIPFNDERYPLRLREIQHPPILLYCRGMLPNWDKLLCVGVVGTRKMSEYGCRAAYKISYGLAEVGVVTISGMAKGVDSVVASASLAAGGHTIAVLGCGIDIIYPPQNRIIYNEILKRGTIISEYPPGTRPTQYSFPQRNRIISGISQGTFIVEGDFNSGAMITARDALVQGRDIFALPGNVGEINSNGTNSLIRDGAHPVFCASDILREYLPLYEKVLNIKRMKSLEMMPEYDANVLARYGVTPEFINVTKTKASESVRRDSETVKAPVKKSDIKKEKHDDGSKTIYESLSPELRRVYDRLPQDSGAVSIDRLTGDGVGTKEVIAALTMLELQGLVEALPGGLYSRK